MARSSEGLDGPFSVHHPAELPNRHVPNDAKSVIVDVSEVARVGLHQTRRAKVGRHADNNEDASS